MQSPTMKNLCVFPFSYLLPWNVEGGLGLCRVFVAACGLSRVVASKGSSLLPWAGFSLCWLCPLQSTGARRVGFCSCSKWTQASLLTDFTALQPVVSSQTRDGTCVLCTARRILIHCTTSQVPGRFLSHIWLASIDNVCHMLTLFLHPSSSPALLVFAQESFVNKYIYLWQGI